MLLDNVPSHSTCLQTIILLSKTSWLPYPTKVYFNHEIKKLLNPLRHFLFIKHLKNNWSSGQGKWTNIHRILEKLRHTELCENCQACVECSHWYINLRECGKFSAEFVHHLECPEYPAERATETGLEKENVSHLEITL